MKNKLKNYIILTLLITLCTTLSGCGTVMITLTDNGKTTEIEAPAGTVAEFLEENKIEISKDDELSMDLEDTLQDGSELIITRIKTRNITRTKAIKFKEEVKQTAELYQGQTKIETKGSNGQKEITYLYRYINGLLDKKEVVDEKVVKEPIDQVKLVGTRERPSVHTGGTSGGSSGKREVSRQKIYDCDGSGHGYYVIRYSDGSMKYQDF